MNVPKVDIKQLLEAGVHLGHKTLRLNPKMKKFIFGEKNSIHIIDLTQTVNFLKTALKFHLHNLHLILFYLFQLIQLLLEIHFS